MWSVYQRTFDHLVRSSAGSRHAIAALSKLNKGIVTFRYNELCFRLDRATNVQEASAFPLGVFAATQRRAATTSRCPGKPSQAGSRRAASASRASVELSLNSPGCRKSAGNGWMGSRQLTNALIAVPASTFQTTGGLSSEKPSKFGGPNDGVCRGDSQFSANYGGFAEPISSVTNAVFRSPCHAILARR